MRYHTVGQAVFVLATACSYYLARLPVSRTGPIVYDGARIAFSAMVLGWLLYAIAMAWRSSLTNRRQLRGAPDAYSVPRRFGLGTLFVITLAFALLVTGMKLLRAHAAVTLGAVGFFALVGGLQMAFDRAPRQASMIAGGLLVPATVLVLWITGDEKLLPWGAGPGFFRVLELISGCKGFAIRPDGAGPGFLTVLELAFSLAFLSVVGGAAGYVIGILVGSVFMLAAALRRRGRTT
jgi:hypothetical protein